MVFGCSCLPLIAPLADRMGESMMDVAGDGLPLPLSLVPTPLCAPEESTDRPGFRALLTLALLAWLEVREWWVAFGWARC